MGAVQPCRDRDAVETVSGTEAAALARFTAFFNSFSHGDVHRLREIYTADIVFTDPFHEIRGLDALEQYFARMYENLLSSHFEYFGETISGDTAVVQWRMVYEHARIAGGKPIDVDGCSILTFRGDLVCHHRDYFDAGQMLYERVPVLGWGIRQIRQRM